MSLAFLLAALLLVLAALAFVLPPLLRKAPLSRRESGWGEGPARLEALESARAAGVLTQAEYEAKRAAILAANAPATTASDAADTSSPAATPAGRAALVLVLLLPVATWLLYREVGEPRALQSGAATPAATTAPEAGAEQPQSLEAAAAGLAERMRHSPDDLGGWMLLGRAYKTLQRFPEAKDALANAYRLAPEDPDVQVEYAEALTLASDSRRIEGEAAALLDRALATDPAHQRGLWMKGIQAYQDQDFAAAAATWQRLRDLLPPGAEVGASLDERIADARTRAGLPVLAAAAAGNSNTDVEADTGARAEVAADAAVPAAGDVAASGASLTVEVDIAPTLRAQLQPSDVLFVFARAPSGPRMPVAIRRLAAAELPVTVTLDDTTSMTPQLTLSTLPEVVVGARVSHSGNAAPQQGDLEAFTDPVSTRTGGSIRLVIDRVVE